MPTQATLFRASSRLFRVSSDLCSVRVSASLLAAVRANKHRVRVASDLPRHHPHLRGHMNCTQLARAVGTALALSLCSVTASAALVTFDALERLTTANLPGVYQEAGFQLEAGPNTAFLAWGTSNPAYTGSAAMGVAPTSLAYPMATLTKVGGGAFSLESIDVSEWAPGSSDPFEIVVSASLNGEWVWNFPLFLDGVFGSQIFHFGSTFGNVTEVMFGPRGRYSYQIDNVVLGTVAGEVPEPGTIGLAGVALLGGFVAVRRGRAGRAVHRAGTAGGAGGAGGAGQRRTGG